METLGSHQKVNNDEHHIHQDAGDDALDDRAGGRAGDLLDDLHVGVAALLTACRPGGVLVTFRPDDGARYSYRIAVTSTSVVEVSGQPPDEETDEVVLRADHHVLSHGPGGTRVQVRLRAPGDDTPRTFVVTLDRSAHLAEVERVENVPAAALGEIGLSEIFPAAAGAPPDRPLRPGERWDVVIRCEEPGAWAFHCHILQHAEGPDGMFGMVTALVVRLIRSHGMYLGTL